MAAFPARGARGEVVADADESGRLVAPLALGDVVGDERLELGLRGEPALDEEAAPRAVLGGLVDDPAKSGPRRRRAARRGRARRR